MDRMYPHVFFYFIFNLLYFYSLLWVSWWISALKGFIFFLSSCSRISVGLQIECFDSHEMRSLRIGSAGTSFATASCETNGFIRPCRLLTMRETASADEDISKQTGGTTSRHTVTCPEAMRVQGRGGHLLAPERMFSSAMSYAQANEKKEKERGEGEDENKNKNKLFDPETQLFFFFQTSLSFFFFLGGGIFFFLTSGAPKSPFPFAMKANELCENQKADMRDELDSSVECGSGYISLFGPPSSGKTTLLLQYLTSREQHVINMGGSFHLEYVSARALDGDPLRRLMWGLQPHTKYRRTECSLLFFGSLVRQWLDAAVEGSEIHFVLDDADLLQEDKTEVNHWLSECLAVGVQEHKSILCIWLVSQMPLRLSNCFRYHFMSKPDADVVRKWLCNLFDINSVFFSADSDLETSRFALEKAHMAVVDVVTYYMTHLPMRASIVAQDIRMLLHRVYRILPHLAPHYCESGKPNAMHFSAAWGRRRESVTQTTVENGGDPLADALRRIGYSAMLWAVSAFYCGAVPASKHAYVFDGPELQRRTKSAGANAASHKAAVLSSSAHVVYIPRLMLVYNALLKICVHHVDPLEFSPVETAVQHHQTLVSWGLMVATSQNTKGYRCHVPLTSAVNISKLLSLNLYDLIPQ